MTTPVPKAAADPLHALDDYLRGTGTDEEAQAFEDDLFTRAMSGHAPELAFMHAIGRRLPELAARSSLGVYLRAGEVPRVRTSGRKVDYVELSEATRQAVRVRKDSELLVLRFPLDLKGVKRLEVEKAVGDGPVTTSQEVPFDPGGHALHACCEAELARRTAGQATTQRFWSSEEGGRRRLLAERVHVIEVV